MSFDPFFLIRARLSKLEAHDAPTVKIKRLHAGAVLPKYATSGAAGMDLHTVDDIELMADDWKLVKLGFAMELPVGWEAQVRPRSGLALKNAVTVLNTPGTIDADYRGEVGVILVNLGPHRFEAKAGDRIAQMVIARVPQAKLVEVEALSETQRGAGGFGSTGKK